MHLLFIANVLFVFCSSKKSYCNSYCNPNSNPRRDTHRYIPPFTVQLQHLRLNVTEGFVY